jgi:hypothetical protein
VVICAKRAYLTTCHSLLAQSLSTSSDFMICMPFAKHIVQVLVPPRVNHEYTLCGQHCPVRAVCR